MTKDWTHAPMRRGLYSTLKLNVGTSDDVLSMTSHCDVKQRHHPCVRHTLCGMYVNNVRLSHVRSKCVLDLGSVSELSVS